MCLYLPTYFALLKIKDDDEISEGDDYDDDDDDIVSL